MLKRDELSRPLSCINKALPDEPVFVLRAKDPLAAQAVRLWAAMADGRHEPDKITDALMLAEAMDQWHAAREPVKMAEPAPMPRDKWSYGEAVRMSADRGY